MILVIYFFLLGAIIGSFCNALSYRIPRGISIISPRSRCPRCGHQLRWTENLPIFSFLLQKGRCAFCLSNIPIRYLIIEVLYSFSFVLLYLNKFSDIYAFFLSTVIISIFGLIIIIDLEKKIIPDSLNIILAFILPFFTKSFLEPRFMIFGGVIGFLLPFLITYLFFKFSGKIGLGGGDIKLFGVIGLALGFSGFIQNLFLSCFMGSLIILFLIILKIVKRSDPIAFGPFIIFTLFFQLFMPEFISLILSKMF